MLGIKILFIKNKKGSKDNGFVIYSKGADNKGTYSNEEFKNGAIGLIGK